MIAVIVGVRVVGVGGGVRGGSRSKWQRQCDDTLRGRTRHGIGGAFGDLTRVPQCDERLRLSWVVGVGVGWGLGVLGVRLGGGRGPSGNDSATTRCAGEHAMASEVRLMI